MSDTKQLTQRQQQALTRQKQIAEAAVRLFAENGFAGTTTKQIAQEVGVAEGLIFHYFPTKRDLLRAALKTRGSLIADAKRQLSQRANEPFWGALEQLTTDLLGNIRREHSFMTMVIGEAQIHPEVRAILQDVLRDAITWLTGVIEMQIAAGEIRAEVTPRLVAHMFISSLMVFFMLHRDLPMEEWNEKTRAFTADLLHDFRVLTARN